MAFKLRDLMINVLPSGDQLEKAGDLDAFLAGPGFTGGFTAPRCGATPFTTYRFDIPQNGCGHTCLLTYGPQTTNEEGFIARTCQATGNDPNGPSVASTSDALLQLREQLKQQLAVVEKQYAAAQENLKPQTVEQVDLLTSKLNDALEELKTRRAELTKGKSAPGNKSK